MSSIREGMDVVSCLSLNFRSTFLHGSLLLPSEFCEEYCDDLSGIVFLHLPTGDIWFGKFETSAACISGMEEMMNFYGVKPYFPVFLSYTGRQNFKCEIFNPYGVEISYPIMSMPKNETVSEISQVEHLLTSKHVAGVEVDKLLATFCFHILSNSSGSYDVEITQKLLKERKSVVVLKEDAIQVLRLNQNISWIELCFHDYKWKIGFKWSEDSMLFDKEWFTFTKEANLCVGDILVFSRTMDLNSFKLAVLQKSDLLKFNSAGLEQGKSIMKFYKMLTIENLSLGSVELPRLFLYEFGSKLRNKVQLVVSDGTKHSVNFCKLNKSLFGLEHFIAKFSMFENYTMFFDYVGQSCFYVTIFDHMCVDILNESTKSMSLKTLMGEMQTATLFGRKEQSLGGIGLEEAGSADGGNTQQRIIDSSDVAQPMEVEAYRNIEDNSFVVTLMPSHMDQRGHGVYCPRHLSQIYSSWKNGTLVNLSFGSKHWRVAVHRKKKMCRFGLGWNEFTKEAELFLGQRLKFVYAGELTFQVSGDGPSN